jgi:hypothetical protein
MNDETGNLPLFLFSPLAIVGAGLLLSQVIGVLMEKRGLPKLYGAVAAGLILGVSGFGLVDSALLTYFQELLNAASALVLFEAGRKMDLAWLWRSRAQGAALVAGCILRGAGTLVLLVTFGLGWSEAAFMASILIAVNPVVFTSMVADTDASGVATYAGANLVGLSHVVALLALSGSLAWLRSHGATATLPFFDQLVQQGGRLLSGAAIAFLCYGVYAVASRLSSAQAGLRPGILLATLMMDLGLCSVTSSSALLSLLLMGLLLRNAEKRDNVFHDVGGAGPDAATVVLDAVADCASAVRRPHHVDACPAHSCQSLERHKEKCNCLIGMFTGQFQCTGRGQFYFQRGLYERHSHQAHAGAARGECTGRAGDHMAGFAPCRRNT